MRVRGPVVTVPQVGILVPLALFLDDLGHIRSTDSRIAPLLRDTTPDRMARVACLCCAALQTCANSALQQLPRETTALNFEEHAGPRVSGHRRP